MNMHILGMAKSYLRLKGGQPRDLELDLLRLAYSVNRLLLAGEDAKGYLWVIDDNIAERANAWRKRYGVTDDKVEILVHKLTTAERDNLEAEKAKNAKANRQKRSKPQKEASDARADYGAELGEKKLRERIASLHPKVQKLNHPTHPFVKDIHWDYYGLQEERLP